MECEGLSALKIQILFFHYARAMMGKLTLSTFSGHWNISQHWLERLSYRKMCVQILCSLSPWPFNWDCQQMIAEHLPGSSNFQSSVNNNVKSVFCCQPLVYNNAKSVFCCWECLIHYGPCPNHLMWICGDAHQLICQKLPHKGAIHCTGNI